MLKEAELLSAHADWLFYYLAYTGTLDKELGGTV